MLSRCCVDLDYVRGYTPLELGDHESPIEVETKNVEPVALSPISDDPIVVLGRHNHDARSKDLRLSDYPFLQVLSLEQASGPQRAGRYRFRAPPARRNGEQQFT